MSAEAALIICAHWRNSSDTHYGPWRYVADAEDWARDHLDDDRACSSWDLGILSPVQVTQ